MSTSQSVAATSAGYIPVTRVGTSITGKNEVRFSLAEKPTGVGDTTDKTNIVVKPAVWRGATEMTTSNGKVTFSSGKWASFDQFQEYYKHLSTQVEEIRLETDDVDNYNGELIFTRKDPTGKNHEVTISLSPFKVESSKSTGFSSTLVIPSSALSFIMGPDVDIVLSKIKNASSIEFYMTVSGQNRTTELTPIDANKL